VRETCEMHTKFCLENVNGSGHWDDLSEDRKIILERKPGYLAQYSD
jgi:hypothetical protein